MPSKYWPDPGPHIRHESEVSTLAKQIYVSMLTAGAWSLTCQQIDALVDLSLLASETMVVKLEQRRGPAMRKDNT